MRPAVFRFAGDVAFAPFAGDSFSRATLLGRTCGPGFPGRFSHGFPGHFRPSGFPLGHFPLGHFPCPSSGNLFSYDHYCLPWLKVFCRFHNDIALAKVIVKNKMYKFSIFYTIFMQPVLEFGLLSPRNHAGQIINRQTGIQSRSPDRQIIFESRRTLILTWRAVLSKRLISGMTWPS